jgi:hypothetical protein
MIETNSRTVTQAMLKRERITLKEGKEKFMIMRQIRKQRGLSASKSTAYRSDLFL